MVLQRLQLTLFLLLAATVLFGGISRAGDIHLRQAFRHKSPLSNRGETLISHDTADVWYAQGRYACDFRDTRIFIDTASPYLVLIDHKNKVYHVSDHGNVRKEKLDYQAEVALRWSMAIKARPELYDSLIEAHADDPEAIEYFTKRKREYGRPGSGESGPSATFKTASVDSLVAGYVCKRWHYTATVDGDTLFFDSWLARTLDDQQASGRRLIAETAQLHWSLESLEELIDDTHELFGVMLAWERRLVLSGGEFRTVAHPLSVDTTATAPDSLFAIPDGYTEKILSDSTKFETGR